MSCSCSDQLFSESRSCSVQLFAVSRSCSVQLFSESCNCSVQLISESRNCSVQLFAVSRSCLVQLFFRVTQQLGQAVYSVRQPQYPTTVFEKSRNLHDLAVFSVMQLQIRADCRIMQLQFLSSTHFNINVNKLMAVCVKFRG